MPNCAPVITGKVGNGEVWPELAHRRWRAKKDMPDLAKTREDKLMKASGQCVRSFVSDEWTLEYDLALGPKGEDGHFTGGLAEDVYIAARLVEKDDAINAGQEKTGDVTELALEEFSCLKDKAVPMDGCTAEEVLAAHVYAKFANDGVSKAIAAQYLAERLWSKVESGQLTTSDLRRRLPKYLIEAIDYVTGVQEATAASENAQKGINE
jgi:putative ATP-dependent endonuclease of OLD family